MAMEPIKLLVAARKHSLLVLCLGQPALGIYQSLALLKKGSVVQPSDLGVQTTVVDGNAGRAQLLPAGDVDAITAAVAPLVVVEGMVYAMQAQIGAAFGTAPSMPRVVGLFDSFALWDAGSLASRAFVLPCAVTSVLTSAAAQQEALLHNSSSNPCNVSAFATGNPSLGTWARDAANRTAVALTRQAVFGAGPATVAVLFVGGYGDASAGNSSYNAALHTFCTAAQMLSPAAPTAPTPSYLSFSFAFSPHPGYPASYEEALFLAWGCAAAVRMVDRAHFSTAETVAAANASLSQCSTAGGQSLAIGKPHAYVQGIQRGKGSQRKAEGNGKSSPCRDVFTQAGLIPQAFSPQQLQGALDAFAAAGFLVPPWALEEAGIPREAGLRLTHRLVAQLKRQAAQSRLN